jgi:hypothetical protein
MRNNRGRRRGIFLVEILIILGLLVAFGALAERVVRLSLHTLDKAGHEQDELIRIERAMHALRADVWAAREVRVVDGSHLRIDGKIDWTCEKSGELTRVEKEGEQRWVIPGITFAKEDQWVVVRRDGAEVELMQQMDGRGK